MHLSSLSPYILGTDFKNAKDILQKYGYSARIVMINKANLIVDNDEPDLHRVNFCVKVPFKVIDNGFNNFLPEDIFDYLDSSYTVKCWIG